MDTMTIKTKLMCKLISSTIEKKLKKALNKDLELSLRDLECTYDEKDACINVNLSIKMPQSDFASLLAEKFAI